MIANRSIVIAGLAVMLTLGQGSVASLQGQRVTERFTPSLAHHEGPTALGAAVLVGGMLGVSALVNIDADDSEWERRGVLAYTLPGAAAVGSLGALVGGLAGGAVGWTVGGLLGGAMGESVGRSAEAGSSGARTGIVLMSVVSAGVAVLTTGLLFALGSES